MALAIWRATHSDSSPREQSDAIHEVVDAVGGRVAGLYWTVNASEVLALVDFGENANDEAAVLGARVLVQSGEFGACETVELLSLEEAASLFQQAEGLLEDEDEAETELESED
jgi:hypothetical protein